MRSHQTVLVIVASLAMFLGSLIGSAAEQQRSIYCELLLTTSQFSELHAKVERRILDRTALLREGSPFLVDRSGVPVDILAGLNREMAKSILDSSMRTMFVAEDNIIEQWTRAMRAQIKAEYAAIAKQIREVEAIRKSLKAAGKLGPDSPVAPRIENDFDGLPLRPRIQANRALALKIRDSAVRGKYGPADLETLIVQALLKGQYKDAAGKNVALDGSNDLPLGMRQKFNRLIRQKAEPLIEDQAKFLADPNPKTAPDWKLIPRECSSVLKQLVSELESEFPVNLAFEQNDAAAVQARRMATVLVTPEIPTAALNKQGVPELVIDPLRARFESEMGTMVLESAKGLMSVDDGIVVVLHHGDGTTMSNAASWRTIIPKFVSQGLNPVAVSLPFAGIGMDIRGSLLETTAWIEMSNQWISREANRANPEAPVPVVHLGRSMGSSKGFAHAVLYDRPGNPIQAYIETSFSNPRTIRQQLESVYAQMRAGSVQNVLPESLENATEVDLELLGIMENLKSRAPELVRTLGTRVLFVQGVSDRDGGKTVVSDQKKWIKDFAPRAWLYVVDDPLAKPQYAHLDTSALPDHQLAGQHVLYSNHPNMTMADLKALFPDVPQSQLPSEEDLPAMQNQFVEMMAVKYAFFDFLAENPSLLPQDEAAKKVFFDHRLRTLGRDEQGKPITYFDSFLGKLKLTKADLLASRHENSLIGKLRKVSEWERQNRSREEAFWAAERERRALK